MVIKENDVCGRCSGYLLEAKIANLAFTEDDLLYILRTLRYIEGIGRCQDLSLHIEIKEKLGKALRKFNPCIEKKYCQSCGEQL